MSPPTPTSIMLVTGEYFDHLAPDPSVITLEVLAQGLEVPRFNNQTMRPITVSEHSMRVRRIAVELWDGPPTDLDDLRLWALLHDGHEALVPWADCLRPGKTDAMREVEHQVDVAIIEALGLPLVMLPTQETVKLADSIALYFEAMLWQPGAVDWAPLVMPFEYIEAKTNAAAIQRFLPLIAPRPGEDWRDEVELLLGKLPATDR